MAETGETPRAPILMVPLNPAIGESAFAAMAEANHRPGLPFDVESLRPGRAENAPPVSHTLHTQVVTNPAHVRKESFRIEMEGSEISPRGYRISFEVDAKQATRVLVYLAAEETSDLANRVVSVAPLPMTDIPDPERGPFRIEAGMKQRVSLPGPPLSRAHMKSLARVSRRAPGRPTPAGQNRVVTPHAVVVKLTAAGAPSGANPVEEFTFLAVTMPRAAPAADAHADGPVHVHADAAEDSGKEGGERDDAPSGAGPENPSGGSRTDCLKVRGQKLLTRGSMYAMRNLYGVGEEADAEECIICMTDPKEFAVLPCGHFCLCSSCHTSLLQPRSKCPICRNPVAAFLKLGQPPAQDEPGV